MILSGGTCSSGGILLCSGVGSSADVRSLGSPTAPAITGDDHGPATVVIAIDTGDVRDADVWEVS